MSFKKKIHQVQLVLIRALWGHGLAHRQPTRSHTLEEKGFSFSQHPWTAHGSSARWGTACVPLPHMLELWLSWSCAGLAEAPTVSWAHECNSPAKSRGQWQQRPSPALPTSCHLFHGVLGVLRGWGRCRSVIDDHLGLEDATVTYSLLFGQLRVAILSLLPTAKNKLL